MLNKGKSASGGKKNFWFCIFGRIACFFTIMFFANVVWAGWLIQQIDEKAPNTWIGEDSSIVLDSSGNPHISYVANYFSGGWNYDYLRYAKWNGVTWSVETLAGGQDKDCAHTSIALDNNGNPHIVAYLSRVPDLFSPAGVHHLKWTGSSWTREYIDTGYSPRIAIDGQIIHIAYISGVSLKYAKWNGVVWSTQTVDSIKPLSDYNYDTSISLDLDSNGYPHISYYFYTGEPDYDYDLKYAKWTGTSWSTETVTAVGKVGRFSALAIDKNNRAHISYDDLTNKVVKYAKWTGSNWAIETVDDATNIYYIYNAIALDESDCPHIVYDGGSWGEDLKYAKKTGYSWSRFTVAKGRGGETHCSIVLDSSGNPHISYYDVVYPEYCLKYAQWKTYYIKGYVKDTGGTAVSSVTVTLLDRGGYKLDSRITDSAGYYGFLEVDPGTYTVKPGKIGYNFTPSSRTYSPINSNQDNQNFIATPSPVLKVSATSLYFDRVVKGQSKTHSFTVTNDGYVTLTGNITADKTWVSVSPTNFSLGAGESKTISVMVSPTRELSDNVTYTGAVSITSNGGNATVSISVIPTCAIAYPEPISLSSGKVLTFWGTGVAYGTIRIYTLTGELVKELRETQGQDKITYDLTNENGEKIVRGIYLYTASNPKEPKGNRGKITVIR